MKSIFEKEVFVVDAERCSDNIKWVAFEIMGLPHT